MKNPDNETLFRRMASLYAEREGEQLLREAAELEQDGVLRATPRMDRNVRAAVGARKRGRYIQIGALAAACLALFLLAPQLLRTGQSDLSAPAPSAAAPAEDRAAVEEEPAEEYEAGSIAGAGETEEPAVIPLGFSLPENFAVAGVEQDNAQSVYRLENALLDDVVMTLEYTAQPPVFDGLTAIDLNGSTAWGSAGGGYSLLTFEKDGILYALTCRHDINTLAELGRAIL